MRRILFALMALTLLLPAAAQAAPEQGAWQIYTRGNGLIEQQSYVAAADPLTGLWVGHVAGGRGIFRSGGLVNIRDDGSVRRFRAEEPFISCPSVDAIAPAREGWVWVWLSGTHDYGHNDHTQTCASNYGILSNTATGGHENFSAVALGAIRPDGTVQMLPKEQIPADITWGMAVDGQGRLWVGTRAGLSVREADGSWRAVPLWNDPADSTTALYVEPDGARLSVGSGRGALATVRLLQGQPEQVTALARPTPDTTRPVAALTMLPRGMAAVIWDKVYVQNGAGWDVWPLPPGDSIYGQRIAYVDGRLWASTPASGLLVYDGGRWTPYPLEGTPLGRTGLNDLRAGGPSTLLIATENGVMRLNTAITPPDPSGAQRAFDALWRRTNTSAGSSWVWGPGVSNQRYEPYTQGPGGARYVRYYDKARMELNNPAGDPNSPWFVTNGLLVVELVRGKVQLSDDLERGGCPGSPAVQGCPSYQQVAGDLSFQTNQQAPRYADFTERLAPVESRVGQRVATTLSRVNAYDPLAVGQDSGLATAPTTLAVYDPVTGHNVPQVFRDFMQRQSVDALFAFGRPIAEPAWVRTEIGGRAQWVMVQLFERRALTYSPGNAPDWQVEMGNVGQHYFQWRYPAG